MTLRRPLSSTMKQVLGEMSALRYVSMRRGSPTVIGRPGVVQSSRERTAFEKEFDVEIWLQDVIESSDDELVLTDGNDAHVRRSPRGLILQAARCS